MQLLYKKTEELINLMGPSHGLISMWDISLQITKFEITITYLGVVRSKCVDFIVVHL